jgi:uncharacterized protein YbaR (Trm112 family)
MHTYLLKTLACPNCHAELAWAITRQTGERVEEAQASCDSCSKTYPVREGIGVFLIDEPGRNDLWEQVDSGLMTYLRSSPRQYQQLMATQLESLSPADQFLRGMMLEELGKFEEAREAHATAMQGLYTAEHLECFQRQIDFVIGELASSAGPVVDLASGRCYLVEQLAARLDRPIVATDFSPRVLRQNLKRLEFEGQYDHVSLLAFDARRTPFKDNAIQTLTTNLGLANIENPGALLKELRRIVSGSFFAISHFYSEDDRINKEEIHKLKLEPLLYKPSALEQFSNAGWRAEIKNSCSAKSLPTPPSQIIQGLRNDALPVSETVLEWCALVAH